MIANTYIEWFYMPHKHTMDYSSFIIGNERSEREEDEAKPFALLLIPGLRNLLYNLNRGAKVGDKVRRRIAVLKSLISSVRASMGDISCGLDIETEHDAADSGDLEIDLPNLMVATKRGNLSVLFKHSIGYACSPFHGLIY